MSRMTLGNGFLKSTGGQQIYYRSLLPLRPRALIMVLHGISEHSGRYGHVMEYLGRQGYAVVVPDHRGHGQSGGIAGDIGRFDWVLQDIHKLQQELLAHGMPRHPRRLPCFLLGHSMGGLLGLLYARQFQTELAGLILSGTLLKTPDYVSPRLVKIASLVARFLPRLPLQEFNYSVLSRDPEVIRRIEADERYYKGKIRARTGVEMMKGMKRAQQELKALELPLLILWGEADESVDPASSELIFQNIASRDKTKRSFAGLKHEILQEPERGEVLAIIGGWLEQRLS